MPCNSMCFQSQDGLSLSKIISCKSMQIINAMHILSLQIMRPYQCLQISSCFPSNIYFFSLSWDIYIGWDFFLNGLALHIGWATGATDRKYRFWLSQSTSNSFLLHSPISIYFCPNLITSRQRCHPHLLSGLWRQFWSKLTWGQFL